MTFIFIEVVVVHIYSDFRLSGLFIFMDAGKDRKLLKTATITPTTPTANQKASVCIIY